MRRHRSQRHLEIDWTRCDGHGLCAALFPEAVHLDEWGFPVIERGPLAGDQLAHARRAAASCPALALRVDSRPAPATKPVHGRT